MSEQKRGGFALSPEQHRAVYARGSDILVSAAAGAGKTAVLTRRVIELIREGVAPERLLVVTFTNAAAAEMRRRITDALEDDEALSDIAPRIQQAQISTLHSFCIMVLRQFFVEAQTDPAFRVAGAQDAAHMLDDAINAAIDARIEQDAEAFAQLCERAGGLDALRANALSLYNMTRSQPDPDDWIHAAAARFAQNANDFAAGEWAAALCGRAGRAADSARLLLECARRECSDERACAVLDADMAQCDGIMRAAGRSYADVAEFSTAFPRWSASRKNPAPNIASIKAMRDEAKKIVLAALELPTQADAEALERACADVLELVCELTLDAGSRYEQEKQREGVLDFADLEHRALRALRTPSARDELRERFLHILIDEYQDVNPLQEELLQLVSRGDNLFMVGDVKQSIYGFRMAEPGLFTEKYHRFGRGEGGVRIDLNANYRSAAGVLALANAVFSRTMSERFGGVAYDDAAQLRAGRRPPEGDAPPSPECRVELLESWADEDDDVQDEAGALLTGLRRAQPELAHIAARIRALVGTPMCIGGQVRPVAYSDIAVLFRSPRGYSAALGELFRAEGIPYISDDGEGFFQLTEVRLFLCLLEAVSNRRQDVPLIGALTAPYGGFTPAELLHIRSAYPHLRRESFHSAFLLYSKEGGDDLAARAAAFLAKLDAWRALSRRMPLPAFIRTVLDECGYYDFAGALPYGQTRQEYLRAVCARASGYRTLGDFLASASADGAQTETYSAAPHSENAVRVMSVHRSKGLEFPIVILGGCGKRFNRRDISAPFMAHRRAGFALLYRAPELALTRQTAAQLCVGEALAGEQTSEELRVLYVAMTRARELLIMVGSASPERSMAHWRIMGLTGDYARAGCFWDFIVPPLLLFAPERSDGQERDLLARAPFFRMERVEGMEVLLPGAQAGQQWAAAPPSPEIASLLEWRYSSPGRALPSRTSVTALSRHERVIPPRPEFAARTGGLSAAERGTAFHAAFAAMDFGALAQAKDGALVEVIARRLEALPGEGLLSAEQLAAVPPGTLAAFFACPLGREALRRGGIRCEEPFDLLMDAAQAGLPGAQPGDEALVQGIIDMYFPSDDGWTLVDFKTGRKSPDEALAAYGGQVRLYCRALLALTGKRAQGWLYLVDSAQYLPVPG